MSKAYILLSGGIDSSTCAAIAKTVYGSVTGVGLIYGQRHEKELQYAALVAKELGILYQEIDISSAIAIGGLTDPDQHIPAVSYNELEGVSPAYVPFRNGTMLSIIAGLASMDPEAEAVYHGAHADDAQNWAYPDCTPEFMGGMANAIYVGTYHKIRLKTPLIDMCKWQVVSVGSNYHVPFELTWSCYEGGELHCGVCPTCRDRIQAFADSGIVDPTEYAKDEN